MTGPNLLLTGPSGVGKSSVLLAFARQMMRYTIHGFVSESLREDGQLLGWRLDNFRADGGIFMHRELRTSHRLGRYGVDLSLLERLIHMEFETVSHVDAYIIDEIGLAGPMSPLFVASTLRLLDSDRPTISAVHRSATAFPQAVRGRADVDLWEVTVENRDTLVASMLDWGRWSPGSDELQNEGGVESAARRINALLRS